MKPYSDFDESPVVTTCPDCGEIFAEDVCPYCEDDELSEPRVLGVALPRLRKMIANALATETLEGK